MGVEDPTYLARHIFSTSFYDITIIHLDCADLQQENNMDKAVSKVARPAQMRHFVASRVKKDLVGAFLFASLSTFSYYWFFFRERRNAYKNFYANYDADKEYEHMKKTGIFQSSAAQDED